MQHQMNAWVTMKPYHSVFLLILSIIALPLFNLQSFLKYFDNNSFPTVSSVWCLKTLNQTNVCRFKNLCYDSDQKTLLFFLGNKTVIKGLTNYIDFQRMQLSSLVLHNQFYANISVIDSENYELKKVAKILPKIILFSRFKPDNIMHTIHDDLFPLFLTLESACLGDKNCMEDHALVIHDYYPEGPFFDLYKLFSNKEPVLLNKLSSGLLCFKEVFLGLIQDSIFYQYGFEKPHGPVKSLLSQYDISRFSSYIKEKLQLNENEFVEADIVLVSRKKTRKILNSEKLKQMVTTGYQGQTGAAKIITLDLQSNKTVTFLKAISRAHVLVGMHGAEMIFSLFMQPKSVVIELFPYGIQPDIVSFVKPMSELEGSHLCYFSWTNVHKNNSVAHPQSQAALGGIAHLSKEGQRIIQNTQQVPPVKCCNNPLFLYYMYQDTWVSDDFESFFNQSLSQCWNSSKEPEATLIMKKWFYPYAVHNVVCKVQSYRNLLTVNWSPPDNAKAFNCLKYNLHIKSIKGDFEEKFLVEGSSLQVWIEKVIKNDLKFQGWISAHCGINNSTSPDLYFECH